VASDELLLVDWLNTLITRWWCARSTLFGDFTVEIADGELCLGDYDAGRPNTSGADVVSRSRRLRRGSRIT
jgi:hypothetical protein